MVDHEIEALYSYGYGGDIVKWSIEKQTPKTLVIHSGGGSWGSWPLRWTIRRSQIGCGEYYRTPLEVLNARAEQIRLTIEALKQRIHKERTQLGMIESQIKKAEGR